MISVCLLDTRRAPYQESYCKTYFKKLFQFLINLMILLVLLCDIFHDLLQMGRVTREIGMRFTDKHPVNVQWEKLVQH